MSMENSVDNLAAATVRQAVAIEALAAAISKAFGGVPAALKTLASAGTAEILEAVDGNPGQVDAKAAELAEATGKRAAAARDAKAKDELENAVSKVETDAVEAQRATEPETEAADATPLDYHKDVRPKLLTVIKRVGKPKVIDLVKTYGVDKAENVPVEQLADLVAKAEAL